MKTKHILYLGLLNSFFSKQCDLLFTLSFSVGVLIGAPKANTSQPNITEGGAVFLCPWSESNCTIINFDKEGREPCYIEIDIVPLCLQNKYKEDL